MEKYLVLYRSTMSSGEQMAGMAAEDLVGVQAVLSSHPHNQMGTIEVLQMLPMPGA